MLMEQSRMIPGGELSYEIGTGTEIMETTAERNGG
jgi:hypothetical protein